MTAQWWDSLEKMMSMGTYPLTPALEAGAQLMMVAATPTSLKIDPGTDPLTHLGPFDPRAVPAIVHRHSSGTRDETCCTGGHGQVPRTASGDLRGQAPRLPGGRPHTGTQVHRGYCPNPGHLMRRDAGCRQPQLPLPRESSHRKCQPGGLCDTRQYPRLCKLAVRA